MLSANNFGKVACVGVYMQPAGTPCKAGKEAGRRVLLTVVLVAPSRLPQVENLAGRAGWVVNQCCCCASGRWTGGHARGKEVSRSSGQT